MQLLMWIPFVFTLSVLTYAAILDFRKREVSNGVWCFAYPIGCVMTLTELAFSLLDVQIVLVSLGVALFFGAVLLYTDFYGGADVKALVFVGLTTPTLPLMLNPVLSVPALPIVLVVFCNSALLSMVWPLSIFILNLKDVLQGKQLFDGLNLTMREKVLLLFTTRHIPLWTLEKSLRCFPAEEVVLQEGKPTKKLLHLMKAETNLSKYVNNLKEHQELCTKGVLASPTIPSIAFFTIALVTAPIGTLLFWIITLIGII
ncbi:MAG: prepilin peptidase [Nitrososphaerota archaeon]|jgi:Flp pilus assembly protein protease CpaA|nr:prepilin peptidase [Nitrososphaerota archaeon]